MTWLLPPAEIRERVNRAFGTDQYQRLSDAWYRAAQQMPPGSMLHVRPTSQWVAWKRKGTQGPVDPSTTHLLGLARDASWRQLPEPLRQRLALLLTQQGMVVENWRGKAWRPGERLQTHLHYGIPKQQIRDVGLGAYLEQLARAASARFV